MNSLSTGRGVARRKGAVVSQEKDGKSLPFMKGFNLHPFTIRAPYITYLNFDFE